jgi:hypothetical protein
LNENAVEDRLSDLSVQQWKSGIAAWLGWLFDGLDMPIYVLVATPFVAELLGGYFASNNCAVADLSASSPKADNRPYAEVPASSALVLLT